MALWVLAAPKLNIDTNKALIKLMPLLIQMLCCSYSTHAFITKAHHPVTNIQLIKHPLHGKLQYYL